MKRIVTHMLVAVGLAAGACGVAQAHSNLSIGLSLGTPAPAYVAPAYVAPAPQPVYYGNRYWGDRRYDGYRHDRGWDRGRWDHRNRWDNNNGYRGNDNHRGGYRD
ncbi:putative signal peptide protein [Paraburkholderia caribensis MBA4]|uniref:Putative signal peptide protein n=1 Tax=Paraburkholderia caribensis MBA4 TaxID=1323664 RepID=A0A0P0R6A4_9BURK|nr:hypothetical protein [Paraburkholderia caribensis]ALL63623.1 putative signal peptide protein [Paraburkholderia caribensis MBA4]